MTILRWSLSAAILALASQTAFAQQVIGAGGQIQQIPPAPMQENTVPALPIPQRETLAPVPAGARFPVKLLRVTGEARFSQAELIAAARFQAGGELTLPDLQAMTSRITDYYNQHGYFLARAYLPAQDITDGLVTINVVEGYYGQVGLRNKTNVSDVVLVRILDGLDRGDAVQSAPLERRLLIISDLPGVRVNSTLAPGAAVGTADLIVGVTPGPRIDGDVEADNWGNPYTGAYRVGGTVNWNEPFGYGDVLSLRTLESTDGGLAYGRVSYQAQLWDATVGAALTGFKYRLGKQFQSLNANGWEGIASVYASYPLIRSYDNNLNLLADFDQRFFQDNIGAFSTSTDKRASVLTVGVNGDFNDTFAGGGLNTYSLAGTFGDLSVESPAARAEDKVTARTGGGYAKLSASASRLQALVGPLSLYVGARGQVASKNLDISEKMELGGASGVRAYPEGEAYGDDGYIATLEPRLRLPWPAALPGQVQLIAFVDTGYVRVDHSRFSNAENNLFRSGAGLGLTWSDPNNFMVTATYAHMLGNARATSYHDDAGEFWAEAIKYF